MTFYNEQEIVRAITQTIEGVTALDDILVMLCIQFAKASPAQASDLAGMIRAVLESDQCKKSTPFMALASRALQALTGESVLFPSFTGESLSPEDL